MAVKKATTKTVSKVSSIKVEPKKTTPAPKQVVKKAAPAKKAEEKSATKTKSPSSNSLSKLWDQEADASKASNRLPDGEQVVRLNSIQLNVDKKKGAAVFAEFEAIDGEAEGKKGRQMYKLTDENGDKAAGMDYLARDFALLGYEKVEGDELEATLEALTEAQPMVVVRVKDGGQWVNIYIQGLAEDGAENIGNNGEEADEAIIEVGSEVSFESEGETVTGKVLKITDGVARVKTDDGNYDVDLADLATGGGEEEETTPEIEVGSTASFESEGGSYTGEVKKIKGDNAVVEVGDDSYQVALSDLTIDDGSGGVGAEGVDIEVGSRVTWDDDGTQREGEVTKISSDGDSAVVMDDDKDKYKVDMSELTLA